MATEALIHPFFDLPTNTVTYLVACPVTRKAAVVDPVLDYDHSSGKVSVASADRVLQKAADEGFEVDWVLETHVHADHLSGAPYIKIMTGAKVAIGEHIRDVQKIFRPVFNALDVSGTGSEFDFLFGDGDHFQIGALDITVLATPGHTPACVSYQCGTAVFVGDTLFMPIMARRGLIFPVGMRGSFTVRSANCCRCRQIRVFSCATTICRNRAAPITGGRRR